MYLEKKVDKNFHQNTLGENIGLLRIKLFQREFQKFGPSFKKNLLFLTIFYDNRMTSYSTKLPS